MQVLILGSQGMLGRALVREFANEEVTAWDRTHLDITDEQAVAEALPMLEPDLVINAAAYTDVEKAELETEEADAVNGYAVGNLAVTCAEERIPLLHISTNYVFDGKKQEGYGEDDEPSNPVNAYGRSKLLGETLLRENGKNYWLVRTAGLFGPHGKHFVDRIITLADEKPVIPVVADQRLSPTSTADLARAIRELVQSSVPPGVYHLVNSGIATWADLAEFVLTTLGKSARVERIAASDPVLQSTHTAQRPSWSVLRNSKRPPLRPWKEAVRDYLRLRHDAATIPEREITRETEEA